MKVKGWRQVMAFTFTQNFKTKSFRVGTAIIALIFALIIVAVNLLPKELGGEGFFSSLFDDKQMIDIKNVQIYNETELNIQYTDITEFDAQVNEITADEYEAARDKVTASAAAEALVHIYYYLDEAYEELPEAEQPLPQIIVNVYRPESTELIGENACTQLGGAIADLVHTALLESLGVSADEVNRAKVGISSQVTLFTGEEEQDTLSHIMNGILPIVIAFALFMFIIGYSQTIAQSIAMEKTSRVMELLLTSVRPLAVIIGKVAGTLLLCVVQALIIGTVSSITFIAVLPFGFIPDALDAMNTMSAAMPVEASTGIGQIVSEMNVVVAEAIPGLFNPLAIIEIIVVFILGFLFYSLLAGLVGASVSRIEDLATAMQSMSFIAVIGFFLAYFPPIINMDGEVGLSALQTLSYYLPISSPFALPAAILLGNISVAEGAVSVLVLMALVVLTTMLVAKVYHHIVLHSGNPLKLSDLLKLARKQ